MAAVAATAAADPLLREVTELVRAAVAKVCPQGLGVLEDPKAAVGFRPAYLSKPGAAVADLECKAPSLIFWRLRAGGKRKRPRSRSPSPGAGPEPSPGASSDLVAISSAQGAASDVDLEGLTERIVEAMDTAIVTRLLAGVHHRDHGSAKGTIVMVSRRANLRAAAAGFLLCGACGRFAKGETGLWWHVMKAHLSSVVDAKETAARASEAIQLYDAAAGRHTWHAASMEPPLAPAEEPRRPLSRTLRAAQTGDLAALRALAAEGQWDANERDRNGATPLLWAAGGGHLGVVRFLVEEAGVDAADLQTGRRGYAGRSALHWACRNGHVGVAAYLVGKGCAKDIATQDGTTPFHFAAWQGE
uniref:C2H2-type domain-containing protein n=1 Tax=Phaeomonas parva TaxID=124430 RepID=A0A7S1XNI0_9STRA|mmetsp:Transcript_23024/g.71639  ORF Transcript_23024/g.71639 Transcript_23024/m.71639 type:complete len:359 (+) Transcript_23024:194-1270(+)